jgi:predicted Fe-Mo cluster-binding NifX family protein
MKIAIPTYGRKGLKEQVSEHFGRCQTYTIIDDQGNLLEIIENTSSHNGGVGLPPELLKKQNIDLLLCRGLGPKALELCHKLGILVCVSKGATVLEIFQSWQKDPQRQATIDDVCEEHKS